MTKRRRSFFIIAAIYFRNLIPVFGVLFFSWNLFSILLVYFVQQITENYFLFKKLLKGSRRQSFIVMLGLTVVVYLLLKTIESLGVVLEPSLSDGLMPITELATKTTPSLLFSLLISILIEMILSSKRDASISDNTSHLYSYSLRKIIILISLFGLFVLIKDITALNIPVAIISFSLLKIYVDRYFEIKYQEFVKI